jgi:hypothetical protein
MLPQTAVHARGRFPRNRCRCPANRNHSDWRGAWSSHTRPQQRLSGRSRGIPVRRRVMSLPCLINRRAILAPFSQGFDSEGLVSRPSQGCRPSAGSDVLPRGPSQLGRDTSPFPAGPPEDPQLMYFSPCYFSQGHCTRTRGAPDALCMQIMMLHCVNMPVNLRYRGLPARGAGTSPAPTARLRPPRWLRAGW